MKFDDFPDLFKVMMVIGKLANGRRGVHSYRIFEELSKISDQRVVDSINMLIEAKIISGGHDMYNGNDVIVYWVTYDHLEFVNKLVDMFYAEG